MEPRIGIQFNWQNSASDRDLSTGPLRKLAKTVSLDADHVSIYYPTDQPSIKHIELDLLKRELYKSLPLSDYSNIYCYVNYRHPDYHNNETTHEELISEIKDRTDLAANLAAKQPLFAEILRKDARYNDYNALFITALDAVGDGPLKISLSLLFEGEKGEEVVFVSCMVE
ncbi:hypothetical protein A3850_001980 [Lewinella sp. 4G2]|nr:hypothetical protein A3850_001980 [Lewinella sp. 4G2]